MLTIIDSYLFCIILKEYELRKYEIMFIFDTEAESMENIKAFVTDKFSNNKVDVLEEKDIGKKKFSVSY